MSVGLQEMTRSKGFGGGSRTVILHYRQSPKTFLWWSSCPGTTNTLHLAVTSNIRPTADSTNHNSLPGHSFRTLLNIGRHYQSSEVAHQWNLCHPQPSTVPTFYRWVAVLGGEETLRGVSDVIGLFMRVEKSLAGQPKAWRGDQYACKNTGRASPREVEIVKVKSAFFRCSLGYWPGLEVLVKVHSSPIPLAERRDQTSLSQQLRSFVGMCVSVLLVSKLVFLLLARLATVKVGFWRLKPVGIALI